MHISFFITSENITYLFWQEFYSILVKLISNHNFLSKGKYKNNIFNNILACFLSSSSALAPQAEWKSEISVLNTFIIFQI